MLAFLLALAIARSSPPRARRRRSRCRSSARRSCSSPTSAARCRRPTSRPTRLVAARSAAQALRGQGAQDGQRRRHGVQRARRRVLAVADARPRRDQRRARPACRPAAAPATGEAIQAATRVLRQPPGVNGKRPPAAIVLLSDGASTGGDRSRGRRAGGAQAAHPDLHRRARHAPGHDHRSASGRRRRHRDAPGAARPAVARRDRAAPRAARPTPPPTRAGSSDVYKSLGSPARAPRTRSARSPPASPAAASFCCSLGAAMSLRWFGRLI